MNISNLTLIQQIAIAAMNSPLKIINTGTSGPFNHRFGQTPIYPSNTANELTGTTFKKLKSIQLSTPSQLKIKQQAGMFVSAPSVTFVGQVDGTVTVNVYEQLTMNDAIDEVNKDTNVVFDRFGINGNITIKGTLKESLLHIGIVFSCLSELSGQDSNNILEVIKELTSGLEAAEKLDTKVEELFPSNKSNFDAYAVLADSVTFKDWEYDDNTGQVINMPPIICERTFEGTLNVSYTFANEVSNLNRLHVSYNEPEDKETGILSVSVSFNQSEKQLICEVEIAIGLTPINFMKVVAEVVTGSIETLPNKERFVGLTSHLANNILDAASFLETTTTN